jgi:hypothetical protein
VRSGISSTTITHSNAPNVVSLPLHDYHRPCCQKHLRASDLQGEHSNQSTNQSM